MATWNDLNDELNRWQDTGKDATFWWRDDDAIEPTDLLERLIQISSDNTAPCMVAVVPHLAVPALTLRLNDAPTIYPAQHGYRHINHAPEGQKATEFGDHRNRAVLENELRVGWQSLQSFNRLAPIFVPPWNRMTDKLNGYLRSIGLEGVSQHAPRKAKIAKGGLVQVNTHVDIINWRTTRGFAGMEKVLVYVLSHLQSRRIGQVDDAEPTGVLTHHLNHDEECWEFMDELLDWTNSKSNVRWLTPFEAFEIAVPKNELGK
jgi:hypothetical protein